LCKQFQAENGIEPDYSSPLHHGDFGKAVKDIRRALLVFLISDYMSSSYPNVEYRAEDIISKHDGANKNGFAPEWLLRYLKDNYMKHASSLSLSAISRDIRSLLYNASVVDRCLILHKYVADCSNRGQDGTVYHNYSVSRYSDFEALEKALRIMMLGEDAKTVQASIIATNYHERHTTEIFAPLEGSVLEIFSITKIQLYKNGKLRVWFKDADTAQKVFEYLNGLKGK